MLDAYLETGVEASEEEIGSENQVVNPAIHSGSPLQYLWDNGSTFVENNELENVFTWQDGNGVVFSDDTNKLRGSVQYINHGAIGIGDVQPQVPAVPEIYDDLQVVTTAGVDFAEAIYNTWDGNAPGNSTYPSGGGLRDDGWWYDPRFVGVGGL